MTPEPFLDFYDTNDGERWCWKYGPWSSEEYISEAAATEAMDERNLVFSQPDRYDPYEAALIGAKVNSDLETPFDLWLIGGAFYCEPGLGGIQLGEAGTFTPPTGARILAITQAQFDAMMMGYFDEHGYFPDT